MCISYHWGNNEWIEGWKDKFTFDDNENMIMWISYSWENNAWKRSWKNILEFDLSVSFSNIVFLFDFFNEVELSFYNKPIRIREYITGQKTLGKNLEFLLYYTKLSTKNIPAIPTAFSKSSSYRFTISGITENTFVTISSLTGQILLQQTVSPNESIFCRQEYIL